MPSGSDGLQPSSAVHLSSSHCPLVPPPLCACPGCQGLRKFIVGTPPTCFMHLSERSCFLQSLVALDPLCSVSPLPHIARVLEPPH